MSYTPAVDRYTIMPYRRAENPVSNSPRCPSAFGITSETKRPIATNARCAKPPLTMASRNLILANNYGPPAGSAQMSGVQNSCRIFPR